jgi:hypothetical protein
MSQSGRKIYRGIFPAIYSGGMSRNVMNSKDVIGKEISAGIIQGA